MPQRARHCVFIEWMECSWEREGYYFGERSRRNGKQNWAKEKRSGGKSEVEEENEAVLYTGGHHQVS